MSKFKVGDKVEWVDNGKIRKGKVTLVDYNRVVVDGTYSVDAIDLYPEGNCPFKNCVAENAKFKVGDVVDEKDGTVVKLMRITDKPDGTWYGFKTQRGGVGEVREDLIGGIHNGPTALNAVYSKTLKCIMDSVKPYMDKRYRGDDAWKYPMLVITVLRRVCDTATMSAGRYDGKRPPHRIYDIDCTKDGYRFQGNLVCTGLVHTDDPDDAEAFDEYDMTMSLMNVGRAANCVSRNSVVRKAMNAKVVKNFTPTSEFEKGDIVRFRDSVRWADHDETYTVSSFIGGDVVIKDKSGRVSREDMDVLELVKSCRNAVSRNAVVAKALNAAATNATFKTGDRIRLTYKHPMMDDPEYIDDVVAYVSGNYITTKDGQEVRIENDPCFTVKRI